MSLKEIQEKISVLNKQTEAYITAINQFFMGQNKIPQDSSLLGYFTYTVNTSNDDLGENIIIGDFQIKNLSNRTVEELYLCIKVDATDAYKFSGKFYVSNFNNNNSPASYWRQFQTNEEVSDNEHWFQLIEEKQLLPMETISFSNLQIKWRNDGFYSCTVQGFIFTNMENEGISALNMINVSTKS